MRRIAERYVLEEPLGAGGMGSTFRARDEKAGGVVAIKLLRSELAHDPVARERFVREAGTLASLSDCPRIVRVLDFGEDGDELYTVLELLAGTPLGEALGSPLPAAEAVRITLAVLEALEVCHREGIVHRDVKPANVIVAADRVTLIDFGLARVPRLGGEAIFKITQTGAVHGTPLYMAPEQCRGEESTPAVDIYAAGVVLYEMLAGANPYHGADPATLMAQHLFVEPLPLASVAPRVTAGLAAVVHAMLAKQPEDRPTAAEAAERLERALTGQDPETAAEAHAVVRHDAAGLSRAARSLGGGGGGGGGGGAAEAMVAAVGGSVVVWLANAERSAALRGCLASAGLACVAAHADDAPDLGPRDVVVVAYGDGDRVRRLKAMTNAPVVVVDVGAPNETAAVIRDGASDMLLGSAPDSDLVAKVRRLLRRRGARA